METDGFDLGIVDEAAFSCTMGAGWTEAVVPAATVGGVCVIKEGMFGTCAVWWREAAFRTDEAIGRRDCTLGGALGCDLTVPGLEELGGMSKGGNWTGLRQIQGGLTGSGSGMGVALSEFVLSLFQGHPQLLNRGPLIPVLSVNGLVFTEG